MGLEQRGLAREGNAEDDRDYLAPEDRTQLELESWYRNFSGARDLLGRFDPDRSVRAGLGPDFW
jgi:hypothetical protein